MISSEKTKIQLALGTFGVIVGIVGILHGSAELLKGKLLITSHAVEALPINWPNEAFYSLMKGAPVYSLLTDIPHYVLGLLAICISVTMIVFSAKYPKITARNLLLFALMSVGVFLFGAGEGTPFAICLPMWCLVLYF